MDIMSSTGQEHGSSYTPVSITYSTPSIFSGQSEI